jgi:dynein heavy chain
VYEALEKVNNIRSLSINKSLNEIAETRLCPIFKQPIVDAQDLIDKVRIDAAEAVKRINARVRGIHLSVCDIIDIISKVSTIGTVTPDGEQMLIERMPEDHVLKVGTYTIYLMFKLYEEMTNRAVLKSIKSSILYLAKVLKSKDTSYPTLFTSEIRPDYPLTTYPDIQGLQQTLNEAVRSMLRATKEIETWPTPIFDGPMSKQFENEEKNEDKAEDHDDENGGPGLIPAQPQDIAPRNYFNVLTRDNLVISLVVTMTAKMTQFEKEIAEYISRFNAYSNLWESDSESQFLEFEKSNPEIREIKDKLDQYLEIETKIDEIEPKNRIGPIMFSCEGVKNALISEARKWKQKYGDLLNKIGRNKMIQLSDFMEKTKVALSKNVAGLEDLRSTMECLIQVRTKAANIDIEMTPIDESYGLLTRYNILVPQEETDQYEGLTYNWKKLRDLEQQKQEELQRVSPQFKDQVVEGMVQFLQDFEQFQRQYHEEGPMTPGLTPSEASEKLKSFQHQFDNFQKRWRTYSGGQELFGLEKTKLPELDELDRQLKNLNRLYTLYNEVNTYTRSIRDLLWAEVKFD